MKKLIYISSLFFFGSLFLFSQEFNANVKVDYSQVQSNNNQVFKTLEKELKKYINTTKWTKKKFTVQERIECNFSIIINEEKGTNTYGATLQIQSRRPIYNSAYYSPIINIQDTDFDFKYTQFQPLLFNERRFTSNLVDVITYYVYVILGYDADTFEQYGGTEYFEKANQIVKNAQQQGYEGWNSNDLGKNRFRLIDNIFDTKYKPIRKIMYTYHRLGLDKMYQDQREAKNIIANNILLLKQYKGNSAFSYTLDIFLNTKDSEIPKILSGGDPINKNMAEVRQVLNDLMPAQSEKWNQIK
ncbi:hypothetical protein UJ101_00725 [Flavobacteriaceae bacterium UJ101]|nr:hypothetical protein UJ101_00725 [Flavobacteriaceae bacterium UJ101]